MNSLLVDTNNDIYYDSEINNEPILDKKNERFCLYPLVYTNLWNLYKKQQSAFWKTEEIDFSQDYKDWEKLNTDEKHVIKMILAFFANTDGIVNFNISSKLINLITINEAKVAYNFQMMMENVHSEAYSLMIDTIIKDKTEKEYLFNAITTIPSIKKISQWALKWIDADTHIANRIVAFACIEGIIFSGAFATIFWLKNYKGSGKMFMPGLVKSNEFIARDEGMHLEFACELFKLIVNKPNKNDILNIIVESVDIAYDFIIESIQCKLIGLNSNLMYQYIKYVADRLLVSLGYDKHYKVTNPFSFMDTIGMVQKTNFHENRPTEYQSAHHSNTSREFISNEDF
jgi:ribonucleotide reductase beta subunit family protein with ferritin-like domain